MIEGSEECYSTKLWEWLINNPVWLSMMLLNYLNSTRKHFIVRQIPLNSCELRLCLPKRSQPELKVSSSKNISLVFFIAGGDVAFFQTPMAWGVCLIFSVKFRCLKGSLHAQVNLAAVPSTFPPSTDSSIYLTKKISSVKCFQMNDWVTEWMIERMNEWKLV